MTVKRKSQYPPDLTQAHMVGEIKGGDGWTYAKFSDGYAYHEYVRPHLGRMSLSQLAEYGKRVTDEYFAERTHGLFSDILAKVLAERGLLDSTEYAPILEQNREQDAATLPEGRMVGRYPVVMPGSAPSPVLGNGKTPVVRP